MFTGLIESVGEIVELQPRESGFRLRVQCDFASDLNEGESVAMNGVCLTAVDVSRGDLQAEIGPETARVSNFRFMRLGSLVNLERAMRADARLGGHFVLGHVDATGTIQRLKRDGDFWWVTVSYPGALAPYLINKGSVAVDGISLTVASLGSSSFEVQIVPHTWTRTNLRAARIGDLVNLETDVLGKYVARAIEVMGKLTV